MMEQLGEMPKMVSQTESSDGLPSRSSTCQTSRISLRTGFGSVRWNRTSKIPGSKVPEISSQESVEVVTIVLQERKVPKMSDQDRMLQRTVEQIPDGSVDESISQIMERTASR